MGAMKDFDIRIRQGGDDAIAAVSEYVAEQERLVAQVESMLQRACDRHWKEWIPVADRLPEEGVRVLVFDKDFRQPEMGTYYAADGWVGDEIAMLDPTHWMPLPAPPAHGEATGKG